MIILQPRSAFNWKKNFYMEKERSEDLKIVLQCIDELNDFSWSLQLCTNLHFFPVLPVFTVADVYLQMQV